MNLRISCVAYANTLPFVEGLRRLSSGGRISLALDPPFVCAEKLHRNEVDVSLVPSVELARNPGWVQAGGLGIAAREAVRSVLVVSKVPLDQARSVAVDLNSRTSVALLTIILRRVIGSEPEMVSLRPDLPSMLESCDAALVIGDPALRAATAGLEVLDLAQAWRRLTGLPFVFALWVARDAATAEVAAPLLNEALEAGLLMVPEALGRRAAAIGVPAGLLADYLSRSIHFRLGRSEQESLNLYFKLCGEEGLLDALSGQVREPDRAAARIPAGGRGRGPRASA